MVAFPRSFYIIGNKPDYYTIWTDPRIKHIQHTQRKVPMELQSKLKKKFGEVVNQGIITHETRMTEWVNILTYP